MFILAIQPNTGELLLYSDQTSRFSVKYDYANLLTNTILSSGPPYSYSFTFGLKRKQREPENPFYRLATTNRQPAKITLNPDITTNPRWVR